jgi:hypothetical protein
VSSHKYLECTAIAGMMDQFGSWRGHIQCMAVFLLLVGMIEKLSCGKKPTKDGRKSMNIQVMTLQVNLL